MMELRERQRGHVMGVGVGEWGRDAGDGTASGRRWPISVADGPMSGAVGGRLTKSPVPPPAATATVPLELLVLGRRAGTDAVGGGAVVDGPEGTEEALLPHVAGGGGGSMIVGVVGGRSTHCFVYCFYDYRGDGPTVAFVVVELR